jgi:hypothetical protein
MMFKGLLGSVALLTYPIIEGHLVLLRVIVPGIGLPQVRGVIGLREVAPRMNLVYLTRIVLDAGMHPKVLSTMGLEDFFYVSSAIHS